MHLFADTLNTGKIKLIYIPKFIDQNIWIFPGRLNSKFNYF